jgi:hypothetical protein
MRAGRYEVEFIPRSLVIEEEGRFCRAGTGFAALHKGRDHFSLQMTAGNIFPMPSIHFLKTGELISIMKHPCELYDQPRLNDAAHKIFVL